jgi:hypothetical protein
MEISLVICGILGKAVLSQSFLSVYRQLTRAFEVPHYVFRGEKKKMPSELKIFNGGFDCD